MGAMGIPGKADRAHGALYSQGCGLNVGPGN